MGASSLWKSASVAPAAAREFRFRGRSLSGGDIGQALAKLAQRLEGVAREGSAADDDARGTAHARREWTALAVHDHAVGVEICEGAEAVPHPRGADPADGGRARPVALIGERVVEQLHALARPHERHAALGEGQLSLEPLALANDLRDQVALLDHGAATPHGQLQDDACAGGHRRELVAAVHEVLVEDRFADARPIELFAQPSLGLLGFRPPRRRLVTQLLERAPRVLPLRLRLLHLQRELLRLDLDAARLHPAREAEVERLLLPRRHLARQFALPLLDDDGAAEGLHPILELQDLLPVGEALAGVPRLAARGSLRRASGL